LRRNVTVTLFIRPTFFPVLWLLAGCCGVPHKPIKKPFHLSASFADDASTQTTAMMPKNPPNMPIPNPIQNNVIVFAPLHDG
jgi:hypothetical protein